MGYNKEAMLANIDKCDVNIKTFEDAIQKEEDMKRELRRQIRIMDEQEEEKERIAKEVVENIEVVEE